MRKRRGMLLVAVTLLLIIGGRWYVEAVNRDHPAPWPMRGGSAGLRHYTPAIFPRAPELLWSSPMPGADSPSPLIGADSTLYVSAANEIHAVRPDGKRRWLWRAPERIWSMALSRHGELYAMDSESLHALDAEGRLLWRTKHPGTPVTPLMVGQGGLLYYATGDRVHELGPDGAHRWSQNVGTVLAGPVESAGGLILVASTERLTALRPGGQVAWSRALGEPVPIRPLAAGPDGRLYLRVKTAILVLNEKGEIIGDQPVTPSPATLAVGDSVLQDGYSRRDPTARELFTVASLSPHRQISTMIDSRGQVLILEQTGLVRVANDRVSPQIQYRLWDPEGRELWLLEGIRPTGQPAVDAKGNLCFVGQLQQGEPAALICVGDKAAAK